MLAGRAFIDLIHKVLIHKKNSFLLTDLLKIYIFTIIICRNVELLVIFHIPLMSN